MNYLVIAEKSEVSRAIESAISKNKYDRGSTYRFAPCSGHLLELKSPEDYDPKYREWNIADLPIAFRNWELVPKKDGDGISGAVARRLEKIRDGLEWCDAVIHAGDPDDEGQLIVDEVLGLFNNTKPVLRLDLNDTTEAYIIKQLGCMKDNASQVQTGRAAYARSVADAMFGFNYTRYYTKAYGSKTPLSIGRVQTPTLGLVVNRDRLIDGHSARKYYTLIADVVTPEGVAFPMVFSFPKDDPVLQDGKVTDPAAFDSIKAAIEDRTFTAEVKKKTVSDSPPLPFSLAELQGYCSRTFGLSPDRTLEVTQSLRGKALITYNRSSCQYLHEFQHAEAPAALKTVFSNLNIDPPVDFSIKSRAFDDRKLQGEPHHAIICTNQKADLSQLSKDELSVYKAVALYYMVQFMPARERLRTTAELAFKNGSLLSAVGSVTTKPGWYGFMHHGKSGDEDIDEETGLSTLSRVSELPEGPVKIRVTGCRLDEKETVPPKRYTQASLIKDMSQVTKYVTDPRIKQILIEKDADRSGSGNYGSIGTPATQATIVKTLIERGYLEEKKGRGKARYIESTALGKNFYDALDEKMRDVGVTADWAVMTKDIQLGNCSEDTLFDSLLEQINGFLASPPELKPIPGVVTVGSVDATRLGTCPRCGGSVSKGRSAAFCSSGCGFIMKSALGKELDDSQISRLLAGQTIRLTGLVRKDGEKYSADIRIGALKEFQAEDRDGGRRTLCAPDYEFVRVPLGKCPVCGADVFMGKNSAYCGADCGFRVRSAFGKELSESQIKALLAGKPVKLTGLVSSSGEKYDASVIMNGTKAVPPEEGQEGRPLTVPAFEFTKTVLGKCPVCGQDVVRGKSSAYCSGGCGFIVRSVHGKEFSDAQIKSLLDGKAVRVDGMTAKDGRNFSAHLKMNGTRSFSVPDENGGEKTLLAPEFEFVNNVIGKCPACGRDVIEGERGFGCVGFREDPPCRFTIWKENSLLSRNRRSVTQSMAKELLQNGRCSAGTLISKNGTPFTADFVLEKDETGKYSLKLAFEDAKYESGGYCVGFCPKCGRRVVEGNLGFACVGILDEQKPCDFEILKRHAILSRSGRELDHKMMRELLESGRCRTGKLTSAKGTDYEARFELAEKDGKFVLNMIFGADDEPLGSCPRCGGRIHKSGPFYICGGKKDAPEDPDAPRCRFRLYESQFDLPVPGVKLSPDMVKELLSEAGRTRCSVPSGDGSSREFVLRLDDSGKYPKAIPVSDSEE